jgi:hypothetical protein
MNDADQKKIEKALKESIKPGMGYVLILIDGTQVDFTCNTSPEFALNLMRQTVYNIEKQHNPTGLILPNGVKFNRT